MNELNNALNSNINVIVVFTLMLLALSLIMLVGAAITLIPQISRTLGAFEKLASTVEIELEPTLSEANKLLGGVLKLQNIATTGVAGVQNKVEDVTGNISKAANQAQHHSSIWGAGLAAGVKAYLEAKGDSSEKKGVQK
jgi:uncharacterized protein YoxC